MSVTDSRVSWSEYWRSRPYRVPLTAMALLAGLIAMYGVLGIFAVFGLWRNNLFKLDTNWPWAAPLAAISLFEVHIKRPGLIHAIVFFLLLAIVGIMIVASGMLNDLPSIWPSPTGLLAIGLTNFFAFRWLAAKVASDGTAEAVPGETGT